MQALPGREARPSLEQPAPRGRPESDTAVLSPKSVVMLPQVGQRGLVPANRILRIE